MSRCHYIKDPETGQRILIPGCMGTAARGIENCTCYPTRKAKDMKNKEFIVCASIWFDDEDFHENPHCKAKNIDTGYVIAGLRHCNCLATFQTLSGRTSPQSGIVQTQGFLTSLNRFVDRIEALKIATKAEQIITTTKIRMLHSDDLY